MTNEIAFDTDGETLLINRGRSGGDDKINRVPFVAALSAIAEQCAAAPDEAAAYMTGEIPLDFHRRIKESLAVPIDFSDLSDLITFHLHATNDPPPSEGRLPSSEAGLPSSEGRLKANIAVARRLITRFRNLGRGTRSSK